MFLRSISATRTDDYGYSSRCDYSKPMTMTVTVGDEKSETKITLDDQACARVLSVLAEELAAQARRVAETMVAQTFIDTTPALPAPEPFMGDEEVPF